MIIPICIIKGCQNNIIKINGHGFIDTSYNYEEVIMMKIKCLLVFLLGFILLSGNVKGASVIYLSDLPASEIWEQNIHGGLQKDTVYWMDCIYVYGNKHLKGLGMHAPAEGEGFALFSLPDRVRTFSTKIVLCDANKTEQRGWTGAKVEFAIFVKTGEKFEGKYRKILNTQDDIIIYPSFPCVHYTHTW